MTAAETPDGVGPEDDETPEERARRQEWKVANDIIETARVRLLERCPRVSFISMISIADEEDGEPITRTSRRGCGNQLANLEHARSYVAEQEERRRVAVRREEESS